jgi:predicted lipoprotein with Yx(FWY)xxD motif
MNRTRLVLAPALLCLALSTSAATAGAGSVPAAAARAAKVQLRQTSLGKILVDASGFTVYRFTRDARGKDSCLKVSGCTETWPPLLTSGHPLAGAGVKASLLSAIPLSGGRKQVTYGGFALYMYKPAIERGETGYVGVSSFGGTWYAVSGAGKLVK